MNDIDEFALGQAEAAAARLWALGTAVFPLAGGGGIQRHVNADVTETAISFAIHARRVLDNRLRGKKFQLNAPYRIWKPEKGLTKVQDLRFALNRIVHAVDFQVGFELLPSKGSKGGGDTIGVIYLKTRTDEQEAALIDIFAMASCFFFDVLPALSSSGDSREAAIVH
jgi:hypothetical protein